MRALGYPSQELLASWIDELEPGRRTKRADASRIPDKMKEKAVIDLVTREGSAKEVSDGLGAEGPPSTIGSGDLWTRRRPAR